MQRVRIGLTGLAFVFVIVLLAAVFTSRPAEEEPITPNMIEQQLSSGPADQSAATAKQAQPQEPLAELGVAPGNVETNSVGNSAAPAPGGGE